MMPYMGTRETADPASIARTIGRRVKMSRTDLGWTLDHLAQRSGVSRRMLINVEQGSTNPSISTLLRLSDALGMGLPALVDTADGASDSVAVHRARDHVPMWSSPNGGSSVMVAGTNPPDVTELWDWRLGPGDTYQSEPHRAGTRELLFVLSGTVDLLVGETRQRLKAGDSASFDGGRPHSYCNTAESRSTRFALAVHEPGLVRESS